MPEQTIQGFDERPADWSGEAPPTQEAAEISETALNLDKWTKRTGDEISQGEAFQQIDMGGNETADFFGASFEPIPQLADNCSDGLRSQFVEQVLDSPEFHELRSKTMLDESGSEISALSLARQFHELRKEVDQDTPEGKANARMAMRSRQAAQQAAQEVESFQDVVNSMGCGSEEGAEGREDLKRMVEVFQQVKQNDHLRKVFEWAGRYRRLAKALQQNKPTHGADDVVGVEVGGELARLLPGELAQLGDDDILGWDAARRLVESQLMQVEWHGMESTTQGPIVVTVDESGSMRGEPHAKAKGLCLTLAWLARHQKRWCFLVGFSQSSEGNAILLKPGEKWDERKLIEWICHFYGGGTSMDLTVDTIPTNWSSIGAPAGKTDLICITDGIVRIDQSKQDKFRDWKKDSQARMIGLILASEAGDLASVCDEVHLENALAIDGGGVREALSI